MDLRSEVCWRLFLCSHHLEDLVLRQPNYALFDAAWDSIAEREHGVEQAMMSLKWGADHFEAVKKAVKAQFDAIIGDRDTDDLDIANVRNAALRAFLNTAAHSSTPAKSVSQASKVWVTTSPEATSVRLSLLTDLTQSYLASPF